MDCPNIFVNQNMRYSTFKWNSAIRHLLTNIKVDTACEKTYGPATLHTNTTFLNCHKQTPLLSRHFLFQGCPLLGGSAVVYLEIETLSQFTLIAQVTL